ncbi:MAG TPA: hypothetical protein VI818_05015, partial [Candidatus Thermoplasmatota archaeon]|nr:hypothetical protein [Candidatus Thermoplasmatota archaeon]
YSQLTFNAWREGMANATYLHGQGGVTLHVLPLFDGKAFSAATPWAHAWIMKTQSNPSNEVPPCRSGYQAPMPSYRITDLSPTLESGWGFRSEVMGCGHDLFAPGATELGFCIEWDGEIVPPMTPYLDGYLYDDCDLLQNARI